MSGVEILIIVSIVMQVVAIVTALLLVNKTKYKALWICCIISLIMLSIERICQFKIFQGEEVSDLMLAWVGIVVSLTFSICVVCARLLVDHVDRMAKHRQMLENRFMTAVLRTEERSRASFSRELHDGLGPLLSSAKMSMSALNKGNMTENDRTIVQNTSAAIDEAIRSLREISNNLSPHTLNDFGLARGIKSFVDRLGTVRDTKIEFKTTLKDERFDSNVEVILYRVVCELVNNTLKHAQATHISIDLREEHGLLMVDYSDDGCGFSFHDVEDRGMGLSNMRSRILSLNGKLSISSRPGEGMHAKVSVATDGSTIRLSAEDFERLYSADSNNKRKRRKYGKKRG